MAKPDRTERPSGLRKTLFKHSLSEGRDCSIEWMADFAKMEIQLYAPFISTALLIDCLLHMAKSDERFQQTGITDLMHMSNRFNIKLSVEHDDGEAWYKLRVYKLYTGNEKLDRLEIELTGMSTKRQDG